MNPADSMFNGHPIQYWYDKQLNGNDEARWMAIDDIRHLCAPADSVPLFLDTLLNDSYWRARALAAHALFDVAIDSPQEQWITDAMRQLLKALNDSSPVVRENVEAIMELFRKSDSDV